MLLLDTDVLIDVQRDLPSAVAWLDGLQETPSIPGFAAMELIQDARNAKEVVSAQTLISNFPVVWPTADDCERAFQDFRAYHLSNRLGLLDALLAACAVGLNAELCTFNDKHYRVVSGLATLQPYARP